MTAIYHSEVCNGIKSYDSTIPSVTWYGGCQFPYAMTNHPWTQQMFVFIPPRFHLNVSAQNHPVPKQGLELRTEASNFSATDVNGYIEQMHNYKHQRRYAVP